jgi:hypothetical protein
MYREAKMERNEENGKLEVEGVVQIVVVDDDGRGEHYPDGDDERGGQFRFRFGARAGGRGGQRRSRLFGLLLGAVVEEISVFDIDGTSAVLEELFCRHCWMKKERRKGGSDYQLASVDKLVLVRTGYVMADLASRQVLRHSSWTPDTTVAPFPLWLGSSQVRPQYVKPSRLR